jgi:hypothetical protein
VVSAGAQLKRRLLVLLPFVLVAVGGLALAKSPWPQILKLALHGARIGFVRMSWQSVGLPVVTVVSWGLAIWLSLLIGPHAPAEGAAKPKSGK